MADRDRVHSSSSAVSASHHGARPRRAVDSRASAAMIHPNSTSSNPPRLESSTIPDSRGTMPAYRSGESCSMGAASGSRMGTTSRHASSCNTSNSANNTIPTRAPAASNAGILARSRDSSSTVQVPPIMISSCASREAELRTSPLTNTDSTASATSVSANNKNSTALRGTVTARCARACRSHSAPITSGVSTRNGVSTNAPRPPSRFTRSALRHAIHTSSSQVTDGRTGR